MNGVSDLWSDFREAVLELSALKEEGRIDEMVRLRTSIEASRIICMNYIHFILVNTCRPCYPGNSGTFKWVVYPAAFCWRGNYIISP